REEEELEAEIKDEIDDAARRAEAAAAATGEEAFTRVFARPRRPVPRVPAGLGDRPELRVAPPPVPAGGVEKNVIETVRDTLQELMAADERVMVLGEDVGPRGGVFRATDGLYGEFGEPRVLDMPLAESSIVGVAIGLALAGMRPIAEIQFADFIHSAFDQLVGVADIVVPGDDVPVVTYGLHRHICAEAAALLSAEGVSVEVVDLRTISPLDRDTVLASVVKTGRLLIVHEDNISFGVGAEVAALVAEEAFYDLDCPVRRLAMP